MRWIALGILTLLCSGCASYEFDVKQPPTAAGQVTGDNDLVAKIPPLEYRFRSDEGRLVLRIDNPTPDIVNLVGSQSTVVDPSGVAHPLRNDSMPSQGSMRIVLPPLQLNEGTSSSPVPAAPGPSGGPPDNPGYIRPSGFGAPADDAADSVYNWSWDGESDVRLHLVFREGDRTFQQEFLLHRGKK
jgi:hypothetical protein